MVTQRLQPKGGFNKPIQLSEWIRRSLYDGHATWAQEPYGQYKDAVQSLPVRMLKTGRPRAGGRREVVSYEGFRTYIYLLHRIGLIEYIQVPPSQAVPQYKRRKGAATSSPNPDLLQPKLDWKTILRDMITSCGKNDFRMMPPNKEYLWQKIYLPSLMGEEINIAIGIDTSGSISDEEILEFLSEVKGICDAYEQYTIYLFTCDAAIHGSWTLHPFDSLPKVMGGRGGTSYVPVFEAAKKLPPFSFLVYLTDLYPNDSYPPTPYFPVIWVSVSDQTPPYGRLIKLPRK